jgi:predicted nucleotidyltransferase
MRFDRLHNKSPEVDQLLGCLVDKTADRFGEKVAAIYLTGSLAYGDFIPQKSDIDGFLFFEGPLSNDDFHDYESLISSVEKEYPAYQAKILDHPVSTLILEDRGELEKALGYVNLTSLVQSGKLIYGREILMSVRPPSRWELDTYMAHDVAEILSKRPDRVPVTVEEDSGALASYSEDCLPLIEWLIYPARVMYTMKTGRIGSKRSAAVHYRLSHDDRYNIWLDEAIRIRSEAEGVLSEKQLRPLMEVTVDFFWYLVNQIQAKMGLVRKGEEEVYAPAEAVNRFRRLLDVA